jgi:AhpD family alkylhydroperoxidase
MPHCFSIHNVAPAGTSALSCVDADLHQSGLGIRLIELIKMRSSQINDCVCCLDMHSNTLGREAPLYTPRERVALAWTEAVTKIEEIQSPDADYDAMRRHFDDKDLANLTTLIGMINLSNRLAISPRYRHTTGTTT